MADDTATGQYSVIATFLQSYKPAWLSTDAVNQNRIAAYAFWRNMYWNDVGGFRMTIRGDEEFPVYVPSARRMVNTFNRYVAKDLDLNIEAGSTGEGDPNTVLAAQDAYYKLFARNRFWLKFKQMKKDMIVCGDMVFGLFADPEKPEGRRISIKYISPEKYFPIKDPDDDEEIWGQQLIEQIPIGDKTYIKIQRWLKPEHPDHPSTGNYDAFIAYESATYQEQDWTDPAKRKTFSNPESDVPLAELDGITALPLYHFRNDWQPGNDYGTSALKGIERIFLAINQTATDEDVALAMAGLGLYTADSSPVDSDGNDTDWVLGPKRVVETPVGGRFERVSGIPSVEPTQSHMDWLQRQAESTLGISDVALGQVDTAVAESGIALALRMGPLLDASADTDEEIHAILLNMFYDLKTWIKVYEGIDLGDELTGAVISPVFGDKLPTDNKGKMDRLQQLWTDKVISKEYYWAELNKIRMFDQIDPAEMSAALDSAAQAEAALLDPTGDRLAQEAGGTAVSDVTGGDNGGV